VWLRQLAAAMSWLAAAAPFLAACASRDPAEARDRDAVDTGIDAAGVDGNPDAPATYQCLPPQPLEIVLIDSGPACRWALHSAPSEGCYFSPQPERAVVIVESQDGGSAAWLPASDGALCEQGDFFFDAEAEPVLVTLCPEPCEHWRMAPELELTLHFGCPSIAMACP
jgi:hypothetical protein